MEAKESGPDKHIPSPHPGAVMKSVHSVPVPTGGPGTGKVCGVSRGKFAAARAKTMSCEQVKK
jgi:hypothetical protein